ncbi:MAG: AMP-binding protein, partial [Geminicoccaceae bacterium]|nr:AMP-binding protein [Geminicoccaceae bacterium]
MSDLYEVSAEWAASAHCDAPTYRRMYEESVNDPETFWGREAGRLSWAKPPTRIKRTTYSGDVSIRWFEDGELNVSVNCIDRHLATRGDQTAIIWESDDPGISRHITYLELSEQVNKLANVFKGLGVGKGDRVAVYMPMIPELPVAMLACARIGAVHSVIFGGFSPDSIIDRVNDGEAKVIVTADGGYRKGAAAPLKPNVDV